MGCELAGLNLKWISRVTRNFNFKSFFLVISSDFRFQSLPFRSCVRFQFASLARKSCDGGGGPAWRASRNQTKWLWDCNGIDKWYYYGWDSNRIILMMRLLWVIVIPSGNLLHSY